jgi:hypothetical protein
MCNISPVRRGCSEKSLLHALSEETEVKEELHMQLFPKAAPRLPLSSQLRQNKLEYSVKGILSRISEETCHAKAI